MQPEPPISKTLNALNHHPKKYNIDKRLKCMDGSFMQNRYRLCIFLDIHDDTLIRWMATKKDAPFSIPTDHFYKIAEFLKCNPTDLMTPPKDEQL